MLLPDRETSFSSKSPGGSPDQTTSAQSHETLIAVSDLIGMDLPPGEVINVLFDSYLNSVYWFMMVFHEPTFRKELEGIITTGHVQQRRLSFLILVLVILANGAKYVSAQVIQSHCPGTPGGQSQHCHIKAVHSRTVTAAAPPSH